MGDDGDRKGGRVWKQGRDLWEGKNAGLDRKIGRRGRASSRSEQQTTCSGRGRRPLERNAAVFAIVVVPSFADARRFEPSNKDEVLFGKLMLVKLEVDGEAEIVPLKLPRTALAIGKSTDHIVCSPQCREGRREMNEGADVLAEDLGSVLPDVKGKPEGNLKVMLWTRMERQRAASRDPERDKVSTQVLAWGWGWQGAESVD